jgi:hypothetical protein
MSELGMRFKCYKCRTKFYDLSASQPICPICQENQNNDPNRLIPPKQKKKIYRLVSKDIDSISHEDEDMDTIEKVRDEDAYNHATDDIEDITKVNEDDLEFPEE